MTDGQMLAHMREEIRKQVQILLHGEVATNTAEVEDIANLVPGMATITKRPVMHPYGFASRATKGTIQVVGRIGEHASNRFVLGHRAKDRPTDLAVGECVLYSADGDKIYVRNGKIEQLTDEHSIEADTSSKVTTPEHTVISDSIKLGSEGSSENIPLGQVLKGLLSDLLTELQTLSQELATVSLNISTHTHLGGIIPPPDNAAAFVASQAAATLVKTALTLLQSSQVDNEAILSHRAFTED